MKSIKRLLVQHAVKDLEKFEAKNDSPRERTYDEKMNARIQSAARGILHSISIVLKDASLIISGAGSQIVKDIRKQHGPRETNLLLAKLPKQRRALTVIGANGIAISFSPDVHFNLLLCFVGIHIKVGNPLRNTLRETNKKEACSRRITYAWHTIVHPYDLVLELKGISSLLAWAVNYDHEWTSRTLALDCTASEIVISLSPEHIQTLLLHLDDYTDAMSSYNEWYTWLNKKQQLKLELNEPSESEKRLYCNKYARMKGTVMDGERGNGECLTELQLKEMESRMTRHEILSLRCIAMKNGEQTLLYSVVSIYPNSHRISSPISSQGWKVPKANEEFEDFLVSSQSSICDKDNESCATALDVLTPFQRLHLTPLHALVILTRERNAFLSPFVTINVSAKALQYDFPDEPLTFNAKEKFTKMTVPSSLFLSNYSFTLKCTNPLFPAIAGISSDMLRPLLSISIQALGMEWSVEYSNYEDELGLPAFPGIVCKVSFLYRLAEPGIFYFCAELTR